MITLSVCVGSSCHVRGSHALIEGLERELERRGLADRVELRGEFCLGQCRCAPNLRIDGRALGEVLPGDVVDIIDEMVMPKLREEES